MKLEREEFMIKNAVNEELRRIIDVVEAAHFRTEHDTGASDQAMIVWNTFRRVAGFSTISKDSLRQWCETCGTYHYTPLCRDMNSIELNAHLLNRYENLSALVKDGDKFERIKNLEGFVKKRLRQLDLIKEKQDEK